MDTPAANILVIDDSAENRALARATLEDEGYHVREASTGADGIEAFAAQPADCVLLDVRMPDLDGFAVCARVRALPSGGDAPVIFLTALRDVDTFDRALAAGGDDFLTKPVRPTELAIRVKTALELRRTSAELREHVALVRRQRDDLMRLQLQKERLTSFVVHDLKNPVFALDLHAQAVLRDPELTTRSREGVQRIRAEARALIRLVTNLLDIARSEEGRLTPHLAAVDVPELLREVGEAFAVKARSVGVTLRQDTLPVAVRADPDLLRRVLENLVDNAVRYAPEGTEIRLSVSACADQVELRVSDAGMGIAPEQRPAVFDRFVQLGGERVVDRTGRGLGLAFCKLAVEAQGGTIGVEDAQPGAAFWVRLDHAA